MLCVMYYWELHCIGPGYTLHELTVKIEQYMILTSTICTGMVGIPTAGKGLQMPCMN